jgi:hypothetical protein
MDIAVLGCGPAGLLVAHAVEEAGHTPHIFSKKVKSEIPGSQHLQAAIPGVTSEYPKRAVLFVRLGTKEGYAEKVYGDPYHECGWPNYDRVEPSWSVFDAYHMLWEKYKDQVHDQEATVWALETFITDFRYVISTIPQPEICCQKQEHRFDGVPYWIQPRMTPREDQHREVVVFNGLPDDHWYRWSILGGKESIESTSPLDHSIQGFKAISSNCNCWPEIHRLGRWAKWQHGVLLHHAYQEAYALLEGAPVGN